jgi:hypothetical protein
MYEEITKALDNGYGDHHLEERFHTQLKRRTHCGGKSQQEFVAIMDHLAHHTHV